MDKTFLREVLVSIPQCLERTNKEELEEDQVATENVSFQKDRRVWSS